MTYLKIGDWDIHANGQRGTLRIRTIDELGRVSGRVLDHRFTGWWNERGRRLTFALEAGGVESHDGQGFEGYAWDESGGDGLQRSYHLAGSYDTFGGGGGAKDRQTFGWFATLARPGPPHISEPI